MGVNYRIVIGNDTTAQLYGGVDALPTTFLIDRTGKIAAVHVGLRARKISKMESNSFSKTLLRAVLLSSTTALLCLPLSAQSNGHLKVGAAAESRRQARRLPSQAKIPLVGGSRLSRQQQHAERRVPDPAEAHLEIAPARSKAAR